MIVHVTHSNNLSSILKSGIFSPLVAKRIGATFGIGSEGSRCDVVQLFDFSGEEKISEQVSNFVNERARFASQKCIGIDKDKFIVLLIDTSIVKEPVFRNHFYVKQYCKDHGSLRYWPWFEVWFEGVVEPKWIADTFPLSKLSD